MKCHVCNRGGRQKVQVFRVNSRNQKTGVYACAEHRDDAAEPKRQST